MTFGSIITVITGRGNIIGRRNGGLGSELEIEQDSSKQNRISMNEF
jgi:hypothetical protein